MLGHGVTNDARHMTAPLRSATQAARAMRCALAEAAVPSDAVGYINAHASSTKAMHGHALGATGAAICMLALQHAYLPPTLNVMDPDPGCDLDYIPGTGREAAVDYVLSNSFGFGGKRGALLRPPAE